MVRNGVLLPRADCGSCCCYSTDVQCVYDHDFRHLANGLLVPHGIYDYFDNVGFMTLGTSRETNERIKFSPRRDSLHFYIHLTLSTL